MISNEGFAIKIMKIVSDLIAKMHNAVSGTKVYPSSCRIPDSFWADRAASRNGGLSLKEEGGQGIIPNRFE